MTEAGTDRGIGSSEDAARVLGPFLRDDAVRYCLEDLAALSDRPIDELRDLWRALGFPDPRPGEQLFTDEDVEMLASVVSLIADGSIEPDLARQFARVIGSSLERIAAAQVDIWLRTTELAGPGAVDDEALDRSAETAALLPGVLGLVWRRRLFEEARRRVTRARAGEDEVVAVVGFADLVGFTSQSQQLPTDMLAEVVGRFETIAYDVIGSFGGRVVKTIGDEVMFVHDDAEAGCRMALELARQYREDDALSDVRVGLDIGPVLERDGDVFGPVVNAASRIVGEAYPGSVVISDGVRYEVHELEEFVLTSLHDHYLRGIGRVQLWRIRLAGDTDDGTERNRDRRRDRAARRRLLLDRSVERNRDLRERTGGAVAAALSEADDLPGRLPAVASGAATPEVLEGLAAAPTSDELDALAAAVLAADIDTELRVDILTEIEAAATLRALEAEADRAAAEADREAEAELRRIEYETARALDAIEEEHRARVSATLERAADLARRVDQATERRMVEVAADVERRAEQATRDARARARRSARQRARRRG